MTPTTLRGALFVIGIGIASAAAVFTLHRVVVNGEPQAQAPSPELAARAVLDDGNGRRTEGPGDDRTAAAEIVGDEGDSAAAEPDAPVEHAGGDVSPHIEALRHPSPTYRNVSLATVIRAAGYECIDVVSSAAGDDGLATWRVSCDGAHAYLVSEDGAGGLRVERMEYFDAPTPFILRAPEEAREPLPVPR